MLDKQKRLKEIVKVFYKYRLNKRLSPTAQAQNLVLAFEELGPTFIKLGQLLSMRIDLFPSEVCNIFASLQDDVNTLSYEEVEAVIIKQYTKPELVFKHIDKTPLASASIAQVHRASLLSGEEVVLKIQRPNIRSTITIDLAITKQAIKVMKLPFISLPISLDELIDELEQTLMEELDFKHEAKNAKLFKDNLKGDNHFYIPKVYLEYSNDDIIVLEYVEGKKLSKQLVKNFKAYDICQQLVNNYAKQIFDDRFFHADPHLGNLLLVDEKLTYLDFGSMGHLSKRLQAKFLNFLIAFVEEDIIGLKNVLLEILITTSDFDEEAFTNDIDLIYNNYARESLNDLKLNEVIYELLNVCHKYHLKVPANLLKLAKGLLTLESIILEIDGSANVVQLIKPFLFKKIFKEMGANFEIKHLAISSFQIVQSLKDLPVLTNSLLRKINNGNLRVQLQLAQLDSLFLNVNKMVNRIVIAICLAALLLSSSLVILAGSGPKLYGFATIGLIGFSISSIIALILLVSIIKSNFRN